MPGRSHAAHDRVELAHLAVVLVSVVVLVSAFDRLILMPVTRVGLPFASTSCTSSRAGVRRLILTPRSSRYLMIGSCRYVCGEPSSMRSTDASVRIAKSMKIVSMQRAEMWSQSMKPSAYAIGSHMRSIERARLPSNGPELREPLGERHVVQLAHHVHAAVEVDERADDRRGAEAERVRELVADAELLRPRERLQPAQTARRSGSGSRARRRAPPLLMKVCVCSLRRSSSKELVRKINIS